MALDLEALLNNRNATATLILPPTFNSKDKFNKGSPRPIVGILTNGSFVIGGSNNFSSPIPQSTFDGLNQANKLVSQLGANANVVNRQIVSSLSTIKTWDSSADFKFSLELTFVSITSNDIRDKVSGTDNVTLPVIELLSLVYPTISASTDSSTIFSYFAPGGYAPPQENAPNSSESDVKKGILGTVQIAVGNWLRLSNMVCDNMSFNFSREIQRNGKPLFATVSMEFSSYKTFTYSDIVQIFNQDMKVNLASDLLNNSTETYRSSNNVITTENISDKLVSASDKLVQGLRNGANSLLSGSSGQ